MDYIDIGQWLKEAIFARGAPNGEKIVEAVREFLEDSIKLRCLPDAILACFQPEEFPRLTEILAKALKALDPYREEIPILIERFREMDDIGARQLAVLLEECFA